MALAALKSLHSAIKRVIVRKLTDAEEHEFESLNESLEELDDERYRGIDKSEINGVDAKIREAAWRLEDVIESYQISQGGLDLEGVEEEIHSFFNTAEQLREEYDKALENPHVAVAAADAEEDVIHDAENSTTIGLSGLSQQILTRLRDDKEIQKVLAGVGKTHLARDIYHHPLIVQRFELRLWVTAVGQVHIAHVKNIFVDILAQIEQKPRDVFKEKDRHELRDLIYNRLLDRKYLIVLDDIWSKEVFKDIKQALPYNQKEQRILVTTRLRDSVGYMMDNKVWEMPFLSDEESWELLSQNVFAWSFPTQLEKPGRKIAKLCEGLPLLILTVADILRNLDQTLEFWNKVAEKKTTTFPDAFDRIYKVLILSYNYLNQQYKAPFLYMGIFPQSNEILVSKLINLWKIEDYFDDSLDDIVSNSLAIVCKLSSFFYKVKSCKLHCTYWYVCVTEAKKNRMFHVLNKLKDVSIESPRRLAVQNNMLFGLKEVYDSMAASTSLTRSLLFTGEDHQYPVQIPFNKMLLLKVLDALAIRFYEFPNEVVNLLLLSYLALTHNGEVHSSISKLQQLHFLILRQHHNIRNLETESATYLPNEIWNLKKLQYLRIMGSKLPDPRHKVRLRNLSRLYVNANSCTEGVLRSTPLLEKLGIEIELEPEGGFEKSLRCLEHTRISNKLQSIKCAIINPWLSSRVVGPVEHLSNLPRNLRKLSLKGLGYPWKYMRVIGSLPLLEELKLRCCAFRGPDWRITNAEFWKLKYLMLEDIDVTNWTIEVEGNIQLKCLIIRHCYKLRMIPFSDFSRMERLQVDECSPSIVKFAQNINGGSSLRCKVATDSSWNL